MSADVPPESNEVPDAEGPEGAAPADEPRDVASPAAPAGDLALPADVACDLLSSHGGEIVITDDGRVVFMNAAAHLVELAAALDPENEEIQARLAVVRALEARREGGEAPGPDPAPTATPDA